MAQILKDAAYMALPMNIKRGNPIPLDTTAVWYNKAELNEYAVSGATAYVGQVVTLIEDGKCEAYVISNEAGTLIKLASTDASGDLASDVATLQSQVAQLILSVGDISQLNTTDKSSLVAAINGLIAANIGYTGKIADKNVSTVKAALDTLAVGNYLDMTADYTASGAASVGQWATMAAAQTATEGATHPAPKYRVSAGQYHIADEDNLEAYDVSILDVPSDTGRVVLIKQINSDPYLYCSVYTATAPGATATNVFYLSTEGRLLEFGDGKNMLLPEYSDKVAGGDYDKLLQLTQVGQRVFPRWKRYEAKDISFQNSMTEMGRASNVEEALDELYAAGTLNATELYETSGANSVVAWAGMADVQDATKYRVPSGTYRVRDVVGEGTCIEHIVTITDTTYEWDNGQFFRYRQVEDKYCGNEPCIIVEWHQFDAPGEKTTSLRYYGDDEEFIVNGVNKKWLPEVTNADNGKCLRVVDNTWQPAPFTEIKSVVALPQNPDPNVLYLIREAEST